VALERKKKYDKEKEKLDKEIKKRKEKEIAEEIY